MKCQGCGAHIDETDERCPYCNSYNENYKKPEKEKPVEPVAPAPTPAPQVIHIYHEAPEPKKRKFKFSIKKIIFAAFIVFVLINAFRIAC